MNYQRIFVCTENIVVLSETVYHKSCPGRDLGRFRFLGFHQVKGLKTSGVGKLIQKLN